MRTDESDRSLTLLSGFLCAGIVAVSGLVLDLAPKARLTDFVKAPMNRYAWAGFLGISLLLSILLKKSGFLRRSNWMPMAVGAIAFFILSAAIQGFLPQAAAAKVAPGISTVLYSHLNSWMFAFVQCYFLLILAITTFGRTYRGGKRNTVFVLMHAGLLLALSAGWFGAPELQRLRMTLHRGHHVWYGVTGDYREVELDFSLRMLDFSIHYYPAKFMIQNSGPSGQPRREPRVLEPGRPLEMDGYTIELQEYLENALPAASGFKESAAPHAAAAARVKVYSKNHAPDRSGWVSGGGANVSAVDLMLNKGKRLVMLPPQPRMYATRAQLVSRQGVNRRVEIRVNNPEKINGWHLYQAGYRQNPRDATMISIVEAVKDPWLPLVYAGIYLMLLGALVLFLQGVKRK